MTFEEISEKAFKREELGPYKNLAEKYAYLQIFNLYKDYYNKDISKEKAEIKKNKIKQEFLENQDKINNYYKVFKKQNQLRGEYNSYIIAIEKSKNQDDILYNSLKFIEKIISDDSFTDRNLEKIQ